jgi:hypothetical protein
MQDFQESKPSKHLYVNNKDGMRELLAGGSFIPGECIVSLIRVRGDKGFKRAGLITHEWCKPHTQRLA